MVVLVGRRKLKKLSLQVGQETINSNETIKYLGVTFDRNMKLKAHLTKVAQKVEKTARSLGGLMPNLSVPSASRRKILMIVVYSAVLYAAPV